MVPNRATHHILQNVAIYLLKYFVSHIIVVSSKWYISMLHEMLFWYESKSNGKEMFESLFVSYFEFAILGSVKNDVYKIFAL